MHLLVSKCHFVTYHQALKILLARFRIAIVKIFTTSLRMSDSKFSRKPLFSIFHTAILLPFPAAGSRFWD